MSKTGLRDDTNLAAISLEWWPQSNWNRWPPSSESALYARVATKTIRSVTSPLERLALLMEGKDPDG